MQTNDQVVINKRMFNFFICIIFFLMASVLVLMGMIWKLNKNQQETRTIADHDWEITKSHWEEMVKLQELTKIQGQTIGILVEKLEQMSKNCCPVQTSKITTTNPKIGKLPNSQCIVNGVDVCIPIVTDKEPTTQNETQLPPSTLPTCPHPKFTLSDSRPHIGHTITPSP